MTAFCIQNGVNKSKQSDMIIISHQEVKRYDERPLNRGKRNMWRTSRKGKIDFMQKKEETWGSLKRG